MATGGGVLAHDKTLFLGGIPNNAASVTIVADLTLEQQYTYDFQVHYGTDGFIRTPDHNGWSIEVDESPGLNAFRQRLVLTPLPGHQGNWQLNPKQDLFIRTPLGSQITFRQLRTHDGFAHSLQLNRRLTAGATIGGTLRSEQTSSVSDLTLTINLPPVSIGSAQ